MSLRRARPGAGKVFLVSGVTEEIRKDLAKKISQLGGKYFDLQYFKAICTHIICGKLSKSEKFLGGCACGKWVLHPDYVYQSVAAGAWLDEEQFEWCDERILRSHPGVEPDLYFSARRWRFLLGEDGRGAFNGWKVAVVAGAKKSQVIKRLLISGGAEVLNLKLPVKNPSKVANTLGYIFVSEQNVKMVGHLFDYGVLCIKPEFIADYLLKDPQPDPMDYLVKYSAAADREPESEATAGSQDSFLVASQASIGVGSPASTPAQDVSLLELVKDDVGENRRRSGRVANRSPGPASQLFPKSKVKVEQQQDNDIIEIDITPKNNGTRKATATCSKADLDGLVIDLIDTDDSFENTHSPLNGLLHHLRPATGEGTSTEEPKRNSPRTCTTKASPAWQQLIPRARVKSTDNTCVDEEVKNICENGVPVTQSKTHHNGALTSNDGTSPRGTPTSLDIGGSEIIESDLIKRKSPRTCAIKSSPAWKHLIPRSRSNVECTNSIIEVTSIGKRRGSGIKEVNRTVINGSVKSVRTSSSNSKISNSQTEHSSVAMEAEKENLKSSQDRITSTPAKRAMSGKLSRAAVLACMSPITAYFKPVVTKTESDTQNDTRLKTESQIASKTPLAKKALIVSSQASTASSVDGRSESTIAYGMDDSELLDTSESTPCSETQSIDTRDTPSQNDDRLVKGRNAGEQKHDTPVGENRSDPKQLRNDITSEIGDGSGIGVTTDVGTMEVDTDTAKSVLYRYETSLPVPSGGRVAPSCSRKRKSGEEPSLQQYVREQKRQKISISEWCPTKFSIHFLDEKNDRMCMRRATTDIITTTFEEEMFTMTALRELNSRVTQLYFPPAETIAMLIHKILPEAQSTIEANLAHQVLMKMLRLHPPVTTEMQQVYLKALGGAKEERGVAEEWNTLKTCIKKILLEENEIVRGNYVLLFHFLQEMLQQNLQHFMLNAEATTRERHMLLRILWCPSYHVVFNSRCRELLDLLMETLGLYQTEHSPQNKGVMLNLLQSLIWMVAMAAECCRLEETKVVRGVRALQQDRVLGFVHEITRRLIDINLQDRNLLQLFLSGLQLPWLCVGVCQQLLNTLDDYLLADDMLRDTTAVTMAVIVSRYFFLLPRISSRPEPKEKTPPLLQQKHGHGHRSTDTPTNGLFENTDINLNDADRQISQINKKNSKGETQLHRACIVGNVAKVKQLLRVPGLDVNARDNFGWTPLHEACNHGRVECVRELLKFVPSKSVIQYFNKGHKISKVDLLACNEEGTTPLHDAVINGQLEVSRLLLQHGGARLLSVVTSAGYTPLVLATTQEMHAMLSSFLPLKRKVSMEDSFICSQDSITSADEVRMEMPSEMLYREVFNADGTRVFVDTKALVGYIHLTTSLLYSYIVAAGLDNAKTRTRKPRQSRSEQNNFQEQDDISGSRCSQDSLNSSYLPGDRTNNCDSLNNILTSATEKENIPSPCALKSADNHRNLSVSKSLTSTDISSHPLQPCESLEHLDKEDRALLKKDIKVIRHMTKYINMFHDHLFKLCRPEDRELVDSELLELKCLVEHMQNK